MYNYDPQLDTPIVNLTIPTPVLAPALAPATPIPTAAARHRVAASGRSFRGFAGLLGDALPFVVALLLITGFMLAIAPLAMHGLAVFVAQSALG